MRPFDTSLDVQKKMDEHYRQMSCAEKGGLLSQARETARSLQLAGLRRRFPEDDEEQLELRLAEIWLGSELYNRVRSWQLTLRRE